MNIFPVVCVPVLALRVVQPSKILKSYDLPASECILPNIQITICPKENLNERI